MTDPVLGRILIVSLLLVSGIVIYDSLLLQDTVTFTDSTWMETPTPVTVPFLGPGESISISTDNRIYFNTKPTDVCVEGHCAPTDVVQAFIEGWLKGSSELEK